MTNNSEDDEKCKDKRGLEWWLCTAGEIIDKVTPNIAPISHQVLFADEATPNDVSGTPEEIVLLLARTAQEKGLFMDAARISQVLTESLLERPQQQDTILFESLKIHQESLVDMRRQSDAMFLQAMQREIRR